MSDDADFERVLGVLAAVFWSWLAAHPPVGAPLRRVAAEMAARIRRSGA